MLRTLCTFALVASVAFAAPPAEKDAKAKVDALAAAKDDAAKKTAIADAGKCPHPLVATELGKIVAEGADDFRIASANALGEMKGLAEAAKALVAGIKPNEGKNEVLTAIFAAIGLVGDPAGIAPLKEFAAKHLPFKEGKDADGEITMSAIRALGSIRRKATVDALFEIAKFWTPQVAKKPQPFDTTAHQVLMDALLSLAPLMPCEPTGEFPASWWAKNKGGFKDDMTPIKK